MTRTYEIVGCLCGMPVFYTPGCMAATQMQVEPGRRSCVFCLGRSVRHASGRVHGRGTDAGRTGQELTYLLSRWAIGYQGKMACPAFPPLPARTWLQRSCRLQRWSSRSPDHSLGPLNIHRGTQAPHQTLAALHRSQWVELLQSCCLDGAWSEAWVLVDMTAHARLCEDHQNSAGILNITSHDR